MPQDLKSLYGEGYKLSVRVRGEMGPVKGLVKQGLPNAVLQVRVRTCVYVYVYVCVWQRQG